MSNKPIVLYHGGCDDGFGAAWAVWTQHPDWEFVPATYGATLPGVAGRDVYMLDFSVKAEDLRAMALDANFIAIIDHHASAVRELEAVVDGPDWPEEACNVVTALDMEHSGAMLTWMWFYPGEPAPQLLRYIEDRDLWRKSLPQADEVTFALRSYPQDFELWQRLMYFPIQELVEEGHHILRYFARKVGEQVERWRHASTFADIGGHRVPCINSIATFTSELGEALAEGYPFASVFWHTSRGVTYSLRARPPHGIDVSHVAEQYGGGGHPGAAGFSLPTPLHLVLTARDPAAHGAAGGCSLGAGEA
jgi:oligoribonuclease NrnB/cAMP/cGMP phosphodiesterase (DHH superfamily)